MFLEILERRNRQLIEDAIELHQRGLIPANSYVLDIEAIEANARTFVNEARRLGLAVLPMTKQVGRNPAFMSALASAGLDSFVAVDMDDARRIHAAGYRVGHLGHLVQVPKAEAPAAAAMAPRYWTVYSYDKAREAAIAARAEGVEQKLVARVHDRGDIFYKGHEGGFPAAGVVEVADLLDAEAGGRFAGITTFPALLFDEGRKEVRPTPNLTTLQRAAHRLKDAGRERIEINAPGTTSTEVLKILAEAGATQIEPGHGLTGTTPLHAVRDLPEVPAVLYLTEVSHMHAGRAYCFGGGLYIDPVFEPYEVRALVGPDPEAALGDRLLADLPPPDAIDYYGMLEVPEGRTIATGDSVVFGFRIQAFVTRAHVVAISSIGSGRSRVEGVWSADGAPASWPR